MIWDNDEYKDLKHAIFDDVRFGLKKEHADKIMVDRLYDGIDKLLEDLIYEGL